MSQTCCSHILYDLEYKINYVEGKEGPYESYYQNGQLNTRVTPGRDEVTYYENGQLESRENYKNGISDGLQEGFYDNGQLRAKGLTKDGKQEGLWEVFFENVKL